MRARAERTVYRLAALLTRPVDAIVRFEHDGIAQRVEIVLHAPRKRALVAEARDKHVGPALTEAGRRLEAQILRLKRPLKPRGRAKAPPA
jgi:ribosome-associated translation inhibitor RaiA